MWDLNAVLAAHTGPPFKPLATLSFPLVCQKTASLIMAITAAKRVCKLQALIVEPPYMHPKFLSQVISHFHLDQVISLPVFFPKPYSTLKEQCLHTLDVRRFLALHMDRPKNFCSLPCGFVSCVDGVKWSLHRQFLSG